MTGSPPKLYVYDGDDVYKVRQGEDVTFNVKFTSTPLPEDEWTVNKTVINKSSRYEPKITDEYASLTIKKVQPKDMGSYTIKLDNGFGEAHADLTLIILRKYKHYTYE